MIYDLDPEKERKIRSLIEAVDAFHIATRTDDSPSNVLDKAAALFEFLEKEIKR